MADNKLIKAPIMSNGNKRKMQSDLLEFEVRKQEEEFKIIKQILSKRSYLNDQYVNVLEKKEKSKRSSLKPLNSKNEDPHKRLINDKSSSETNELLDNNNKKNLSQKSTQSKGWKIDNALLDDSEFRKSHMKRKEKLEISCEGNDKENILLSFNFESEENCEKTDEFELNFNNVVRTNLKSEFSQISGFLESLNLEKYLAFFVEKNIDTFTKILDLNDVKLEEMNIPLGHKLKIFKKIEQIKNIQIDENENANFTDKKEFLEKELSVIKNHPNNNITKRKVEISSKHSKGVGVIPEETIISEDEIQKESLKLQNLGEREFNFKNLFDEEGEDVNENIESLLEKDESSFLKSQNNFNHDHNNIELKDECISCWQCFSIKDKIKMNELKEKYFCNNECLKKYNISMNIQCKNCLMIFNKSEGIFKNLFWFCTETCSSINEEKVIEFKEFNSIQIHENEEDDYDPMTDF